MVLRGKELGFFILQIFLFYFFFWREGGGVVELALKSRSCIAKLIQAKPQLHLSWLALASLNFT